MTDLENAERLRIAYLTNSPRKNIKTFVKPCQIGTVVIIATYTPGVDRSVGNKQGNTVVVIVWR